MTFLKAKKLIILEIDRALEAINEGDVEVLIRAIEEAEKVFVIGVGRVFLSLKAMAKRLFHLGIDIHCVGDIAEPAISSRSLLIVGSGSGDSIVPVAIAKRAKKYGAKVAHIGSNPKGELSKYSDMFLRIPVPTKLNLPEEIPSRQPLTSLFEQCLFVLSDCIAMMLMKRRGLSSTDLENRHANLE